MVNTVFRFRIYPYVFFALVRFYAFHLLSPVVQLSWVLQRDTYLAQRWEQERSSTLYHCIDERRGPAP